MTEQSENCICVRIQTTQGNSMYTVIHFTKELNVPLVRVPTLLQALSDSEQYDSDKTDCVVDISPFRSTQSRCLVCGLVHPLPTVTVICVYQGVSPFGKTQSGCLIFWPVHICYLYLPRGLTFQQHTSISSLGCTPYMCVNIQASRRICRVSGFLHLLPPTCLCMFTIITYLYALSQTSQDNTMTLSYIILLEHSVSLFLALVLH